ncbi:hypothetical protein NRF20_42795 [Streptomyces sp. R-74717]|uniref:hypothetical protein n=1 Tax=Streptomyces TaxID=1883 RepID=UPI0037A1501C
MRLSALPVRDGEVFPVPRAMVAVGSSPTVVIADPSDEPGVSGVWNDQEFRLVGPAPPVASRLVGPMPFTAAGTPPEPLVHLFVRLDGGCLYLGTGRVSMCETSEDVLIRCRLRISPPLNREILDRVRPPATPPPLPGLAWLGNVHRNPGQAVERFLTNWYPATSTQEPIADIPGSIPRALADFYRLATQRPVILGSHNRIKRINEIRPDSSAEHLVFGVECQGGWTRSIPWEPGATDTDPTVWFEDSHPVPEQEPLSRFLLQFSLWEATIAAAYQASCDDLPRHLLPALNSCNARAAPHPADRRTAG